ncbi:MAG TPA: methylmalonyl-CoA epimerase [Firmicutes bacterium]|jgi:methylmalonyl-CoA/ethylmalonyl-CoA epimerase|nr:methylmalonyl-CoA epimerase [Bacillota bacterium]HAW70290.1 methylmalonyl-CoA epimerase [Bacillota bacterium]HAZ21223.1 methylmalonyl-CoA epimerase [Bacillota bacterium]HBE05728.1 methylmalonyl-CoA epimerase [Bacillota bacterium]HBG43051.1 methylmalonyl-CoA epimerase [Bacillota bacterium]
MLNKIEHIGIAVTSLEQSLPFYTEVLGLELLGIEEVSDQKLRVAFLKIGQSNIELLEPTSPDATVAKFLENRGPGIHHIAFAVDDVAKELEAVKSRGIRVIDETPRIGAHGAKIAFLHPKSGGGVLIELCQH